MLTPEVKKYLDKQFEAELNTKEIVEDLVSGGWRKADAETVVRQYETETTLEDAAPLPPKHEETLPRKRVKEGKIDFSSLDSHGKNTQVQIDADVEVGEDFVPEKEEENKAQAQEQEDSKINKQNEDDPQEKEESSHDTDEKSDHSKEQTLNEEEERNLKTDELFAQKVNASASYDDLAPTFTPETQTAAEAFHESAPTKSDPYKETVTSFSPLDARPQKESHEDDFNEKKPHPAERTHVQIKPKEKPKKTKVIFSLLGLWILLIALLAGLYIAFVKDTQDQEQIFVPENSNPGTTTNPAVAPNQVVVPESRITTCGQDMDCFVEEASSCTKTVSVEKIKEDEFFSSIKKIRSYIEVYPEVGICHVDTEIISVLTEFTSSDINPDTLSSVRAADERLVGTRGECQLQVADVPGFLMKLQEGSLTDLDYLTANCTGKLYDQTEVEI